MIKKNTYLVRAISSENEPRLEEVSGKEWKQIVSANKKLPKEQRRYFMVSRIPTEGGYDRMYIEIPYEEYKTWNSEQTVRREKNKYRRAQDSVDFLVESDITTENLLKALALWQPWAVDLYFAYISGRKHQCNRELAEKYQVSERTIRNYKERFEEFVKIFLKKF